MCIRDSSHMATLSPRLRANLLLLLAAFIWGFSFVAQRTGMAHLGPFAFNAVRFLLGGLVLLPLMGLFDRQRQRVGLAVVPLRDRRLLRGGAVVGLLLFGGATLQQAGIVFTTAGKAGFITSLYVVLVPLLGLLVGHRPSAAVWVGAVLAAAGLYFLTIEGAFGMAWGDLLVLVGAFVWAIHFLVLGHFSPQTDTIKLSFLQFMVCAALSAVAALLFETSAIADFRAALIPILYSGILSVGLGYTSVSYTHLDVYKRQGQLSGASVADVARAAHLVAHRRPDRGSHVRRADRLPRDQ